MNSIPGKFVFALALLIFAEAICLAYSLPEAQALANRKDWNGLLRYAQAWAQAEPNNTNAYAMMMQAYMGMNRLDLVYEPAKKGVALSPQESGAWNALGMSAEALKRYPEAVDAYSHAVNLSPQNGAFWNNLAAAYSAENNYTLTLQTLERQEQTMGSSMNNLTWYNLGNGLFAVAKSISIGSVAGKSMDAVLRESIYAYQQSVARNGNYSEAWNNLGVAEEVSGSSQNALSDYQRAASLGNAYARKNYAALQQEIANAKAGGGGGGRIQTTAGRMDMIGKENARSYQTWGH
jgi:tetratricopeptide (TPR) repeat protein